jgi:hypothetical protein
MRPASEPADRPPGEAPRDALDALLSARDVLDGVVLSASGDLLAGPPELAGPARRVLAAAPGADDIEVATTAGAVFAARSRRHAVAVVCRRPALPSLIAFDLRMTLAALDGQLAAAA